MRYQGERNLEDIKNRAKVPKREKDAGAEEKKEEKVRKGKEEKARKEAEEKMEEDKDEEDGACCQRFLPV